MRHHNSTRKLSRETDARGALLRGLACDLIRYGKMTTTLARAKEVRPWVEKMITRAMTGTIADRRILLSRLGNALVVDTLITTHAPNMKGRAGGYTRITKLAPRAKDQAALAVIALVA